MQPEMRDPERVCRPPLASFAASAYVPPPEACDAHVHVFGDPARHPFAAERSYTPSPGLTLAALDALHERLGLARAVIVETSTQNRDHAVLLEALRAEPDRLRGIAVLRGDADDRLIDELNEAGVRGVRVNLFRRGGVPVYRGGAGFEDIAALAPRIRRHGWHVQAWLDAEDLPHWAPRLLDLGLPVVVDHMGRITTDRGLDSPGFAYLRELLRSGRAWCKLSGADRISLSGAPYPDAVPYARALVEANPDRVVWGTDWPHVNYFETPVPDDGRLLELVPAYAPDEGLRRRLLVDNPRALYGFD
jgi:predicted TIM-barrel fold metal-dependent hydrolase